MKGIIAFTLVLVLTSCEPVFAEDVPSIPPLDQSIGRVVDEIPANIVFVFADRLRVAYAVREAVPLRYPEQVYEESGRVVIVEPCVATRRIINNEPTAWRIGQRAKWQAVTRKTWE